MKKKRKLPSQRDNDKWIKMSEKIRDVDVTGKAHLKDFAKFMKRVLPETTQTSFPKF